MSGLGVEDFPATRIGANGAVFEEELESELQACLGDRFDDLLTQAARLVGLQRGRDLLKTWYGCRCFLDLAREAGCSLGVLDELAARLATWSSKVSRWHSAGWPPQPRQRPELEGSTWRIIVFVS